VQETSQVDSLSARDLQRVDNCPPTDGSRGRPMNSYRTGACHSLINLAVPQDLVTFDRQQQRGAPIRGHADRRERSSAITNVIVSRCPMRAGEWCKQAAGGCACLRAFARPRPTTCGCEPECHPHDGGEAILRQGRRGALMREDDSVRHAQRRLRGRPAKMACLLVSALEREQNDARDN
jgi:hypothetical protein